MKTTPAIACMALLAFACRPPADKSGQEAFQRNSQTVLAYLDDWQNESVDYEKYFADDYWFMPTGLGSPDSMSLEAMKTNDEQNWKYWDFKRPEEMNLLPGVHIDSKAIDGSVRYYGKWTVTVPETDSTDAVTTSIKIYQSFDFNEEGKMLFTQTYGDWGGMRNFFEEAMMSVEQADMMDEVAAETQMD